MDVIIRKVPSKAYREFKGRAARVGMRLGDALKEAMESWARRMNGIQVYLTIRMMRRSEE